MSCNGEKLGTAGEFGRILPKETKIRLIYEGPALQSVIGTLAAKLSVRKTAQFLKNQGQ